MIFVNKSLHNFTKNPLTIVGGFTILYLENKTIQQRGKKCFLTILMKKSSELPKNAVI